MTDSREDQKKPQQDAYNDLSRFLFILIRYRNFQNNVFRYTLYKLCHGKNSTHLLFCRLGKCYLLNNQTGRERLTPYGGGMVWDITNVNDNHGRVTCTTQTKQLSVVMDDHNPDHIIYSRIIYL